jgi:hypothetical protein
MQQQQQKAQTAAFLSHQQQLFAEWLETRGILKPVQEAPVHTNNYEPMPVAKGGAAEFASTAEARAKSMEPIVVCPCCHKPVDHVTGANPLTLPPVPILSDVLLMLPLVDYRAAPCNCSVSQDWVGNFTAEMAKRVDGGVGAEVADMSTESRSKALARIRKRLDELYSARDAATMQTDKDQIDVSLIALVDQLMRLMPNPGLIPIVSDVSEKILKWARDNGLRGNGMFRNSATPPEKDDGYSSKYPMPNLGKTKNKPANLSQPANISDMADAEALAALSSRINVFDGKPSGLHKKAFGEAEGIFANVHDRKDIPLPAAGPTPAPPAAAEDQPVYVNRVISYADGGEADVIFNEKILAMTDAALEAAFEMAQTAGIGTDAETAYDTAKAKELLDDNEAWQVVLAAGRSRRFGIQTGEQFRLLVRDQLPKPPVDVRILVKKAIDNTRGMAATTLLKELQSAQLIGKEVTVEGIRANLEAFLQDSTPLEPGTAVFFDTHITKFARKPGQTVRLASGPKPSEMARDSAKEAERKKVAEFHEQFKRPRRKVRIPKPRGD